MDGTILKGNFENLLKLCFVSFDTTASLSEFYKIDTFLPVSEDICIRKNFLNVSNRQRLRKEHLTAKDQLNKGIQIQLLKRIKWIYTNSYVRIECMLKYRLQDHI